MTDKQYMRCLRNRCSSYYTEVKRLRSLLNETANCIHKAAHGHTPNWKRLMDRIEKYEDSYAPLDDGY